jgi:hypothetical protein
MNIFVLDIEQEKNAKLYNDKHCVKQLLETTQILCGVHWVEGKEAPYKLSHKNHPCSIWARECIENYDWLCKLGMSLCKEYTYRYEKIHKSQAVIEWAIKNRPNLPIKGKFTKFALAMPDDCKVDDPIVSYRNYYRMYKQYWEKKDKKTGEVKQILHTWTKRDKPEFMLL